MPRNILSLLTLIRKDLLLEYRNSEKILSVLFYQVAMVYICYTAFNNGLNKSTWNAIFWVNLLLSLIISIGRSFAAESDRSLYYYFLVPASMIVTSKWLLNFALSLILGLSLYLIQSVLLPVSEINFAPFLINAALVIVGLSGALTLMSAISSNVRNEGVLMAVLGFPTALPVLLMGVSNSHKLLNGASLADIPNALTTLICLDVVIIALLLILFPYSWKK